MPRRLTSLALFSSLLLVFQSAPSWAGHHDRDDQDENRDEQQGDDWRHDHHSSALDRHGWSLQFHIDKDDFLNSFQGAALAVQKQTSDHAAWRLGLRFSASNRDFDQDRFISDTVVFVHDAAEENLTQQSYGLTLLRVSYPAPHADVKLYYGAGPTGSYSNDDGELDVGGGPVVRRHGSSWSAGVAGVLGAQWFAARSISIIAEYGATAEFVSQKRTDRLRAPGSTMIQINRSEAESFSVYATGVTLGLAVYF